MRLNYLSVFSLLATMGNSQRETNCRRQELSIYHTLTSTLLALLSVLLVLGFFFLVFCYHLAPQMDRTNALTLEMSLLSLPPPPPSLLAFFAFYHVYRSTIYTIFAPQMFLRHRHLHRHYLLRRNTDLFTRTLEPPPGMQ